MNHLVTRLTPVLLVVFAVCAVVIRAQPYDDSAVRNFLSPADCAAPCFLGIMPGITAGSTAVEILQTHPWVDAKSIYIGRNSSRPYSWATWEWNGRQPAYLAGGGYLNYANVLDQTVQVIHVRTAFPLGALLLALGKPDKGVLTRFEHIAAYHQVFVMTPLNCRRFWNETSSVQYAAPGAFESRSRDWFFADSYVESWTRRWQYCRR
ncbi:MAG: hypothetical protein K8L97_08045 [Anaerolineae bacterium]|nr:hypothetical protein [Anaerolineae bacterium]